MSRQVMPSQERREFERSMRAVLTALCEEIRGDVLCARRANPMKVGRRVVRTYRDAPNDFSQRLFEGLTRRYHLIAQVLSGGQDLRWRFAMVDRVTGAQPLLVLDVACGPCTVTKRLAKKISGRVVALDLSDQMLQQASRNLEKFSLQHRVTLVRARAEALPFPDATFDAVTFTYLLRYVSDPASTLQELARVVKPGGPIASLEFHVPPHRGWRLAWWFYTRALLPLGGLVLGGRAWFDACRFLGPSISRHYRQYSLEWTRDAWHQAGIDHVETRLMSLGGGVVISGYRRS